MRIGVAATPDVAIPTLDWLLASSHEIICVISQPDRPAGRGREISPSPVSNWALIHGVRLLRPESAGDLIGVIDDLDLVITIGYGVILPKEVLSLPRFGFINLHFSLLPAYRGAAPVQRAIESGDIETGVTVFALDEGMDTGPIYRSRKFTIAEGSRTKEVLMALADIGPLVIEETLSDIALNIAPISQTGQTSNASKISKLDALIDWQLEAEVIVRKIRAFYPAPGAWTKWRGESFKINQAHAVDFPLAPGEISVTSEGVFVGSGGPRSVALVFVVPSGKREMKALEWARGANISQGAAFG